MRLIIAAPNQAPPQVADTEAGALVWFLFRLLLLLRVSFRGPRWNHAVDAGIGDGLPQVLSIVADDEQQNTAIRILCTPEVHLFVDVGISHAQDTLSHVGERIFQAGNYFGLVGRRLFESLYFEFGRR